MIIREKPEWGELATFVPNKRLPVYNWFYYKEGYSRDLVFRLLELFGIERGDTILDPFAGVGTTLLACMQKGVNSIGFDVQPPAVFASLVKTRKYDANILEDTGNAIMNMRFVQQDFSTSNPLVKRAFKRQTLDDVIFFRDMIMDIGDSSVRDFFMLALMNVTMKCSWAWKDGAVIKIRKHPVPPLRKLLKRQIGFMINDIRSPDSTKASCSVGFGDARKLKVESDCIDGIITSPPYLNKIEYSKIYSIEEELFFRGMGLSSLRSHIGINPENVIRERNKLDDVVDASNFNPQSIAYFNDMYEVIKEMYRVSRDGAKVGIVVGNGCFPEGVVDSDMILSKIAEHIGFDAKEVVVLSKRWCTKNRVEKVGQTRESLLVWEK
ncbi:MAG: hypothetical protein JW789_01500 [Candidatus Aenigmarchaeota archaeon]|nr:hypothetical protein [Candidatus Aenigmarchaeota archaeon]